MSIIEKVFHFNENQINVVKCNHDTWFKGKDIANALGYENPGKAIRIHVDSDDKMPINELLTVSKGNNSLTFRIENETDLHVKVVSFLKKRFPCSIFVAPLGENQDTSIKRIDSFNKGYIKGTPDLIINNLHRYYTGFAIKFKTPKGYGTLSNEQSNILFHYQLNGFKTSASNDYDRIIEELLVYFRDVRVKCSFCPRRFISSQSLRNHIKGFHIM